MNRQLLQQFRREAEAWNRSLEYMLSENAYIKTRIAEIVSDNLPVELLTEMENFHNRSISKDEMICVAKMQVAVFQNQLDEASNNPQTTIQVQKILKEHIETLELGFIRMKNEFNNFFKQKFLV